MKKTLLLLLFFLIITLQSFATCDFTVSKTSVCAGEEVVITLAQPIANYHNIIVFRGIFPFGAVANSSDYSLVNPYDLSDNVVKIKFRGRTTSQIYTILLAEDVNFPNPQIPCNAKKVQVTVNPSPDPEISESSNFLYCNGSNNLLEIIL